MRILSLFGLLFYSCVVQSQTLRIGLAEDPDVLDPTMARTFVGRIVFSALCDKLFDLDEKLNVVPQLATAYEWSGENRTLTLKLRPGVTFHDGEKLDAAAVKFSLERHKNMPGSNRRGDLAPVASVDVVDAHTVRLNLSAPFAPLLAVLTDRAGMIVSPKAAQAAGDRFGARPVCAGPFRFVERVAQDRIVLERFPEYWNRGAIHFDRIVYLPIVDSTVRLANLRSGQLDFIERLAGSDVAGLKGDSRFKIDRIVEIGYQGITINIGNGAGARGVRALARSRCAGQGRDGRRGGHRQPMGLAGQPLLREERSDPETRRGEGESVARRRRRSQPELHADDADYLRRAAHRAGGAGDGEGSGFRHQDPVDRVLHLAQHGGQGGVRGLRARLERARRSRRQPAHLQRLQGAAQRFRILQEGGRRADRQGAHHARSGAARQILRADRGRAREGPADRVPVSPQLAVGARGEALRPAHGARRAGARAGPENELKCRGTCCSGWRPSFRRCFSSRS